MRKYDHVHCGWICPRSQLIMEVIVPPAGSYMQFTPLLDTFLTPTRWSTRGKNWGKNWTVYSSTIKIVELYTVHHRRCVPHIENNNFRYLFLIIEMVNKSLQILIHLNCCLSRCMFGNHLIITHYFVFLHFFKHFLNKVKIQMEIQRNYKVYCMHLDNW